MTTLTVTSKGQVTLRKDLLQHLGIGPGEKISVERMPNGLLSIGAAARKGKISDAFGMLAGKTSVKLTIDEMNEAIRKGWAGEL